METIYIKICGRALTENDIKELKRVLNNNLKHYTIKRIKTRLSKNKKVLYTHITLNLINPLDIPDDKRLYIHAGLWKLFKKPIMIYPKSEIINHHSD